MRVGTYLYDFAFIFVLALPQWTQSVLGSHSARLLRRKGLGRMMPRHILLYVNISCSLASLHWKWTLINLGPQFKRLHLPILLFLFLFPCNILDNENGESKNFL